MQNQLLPTCNKVAAKLTHYLISCFIDFSALNAPTTAWLSLERNFV